VTSIVVGSALRPKAGETVCGDAFVAVPRGQGILVCLADGLGHGPAAKAAADAACLYAREHAEEPLERLMRGIDRALVGTRGAAVSLLALDPLARRALFAGVGNVELRAHARARIAPPTSPGIVGQNPRVVRVWEYPLEAGDLVALVSDGISSQFDLAALAHLAPPALAEALLDRHRKSHDDACCVVARVAAPGGAA
jgi:negative regulator of sigma-B (phosphoserine phosphatase)